MDDTPNETVDSRFPYAGEISAGNINDARGAIDRFRRGLTPISDTGLGNHTADQFQALAQNDDNAEKLSWVTQPSAVDKLRQHFSMSDPFERAAMRTRQSVMPMEGRKEGMATRLPEMMLMDALKTPQRMGGAVQQYEDTGEYNPAPFVDAAMMTAGVGAPAAEAGALGSAGGKGILAYHGSPHDFDRFDLSKIGTGEGAQAYGHGLYFAENPKVAQQYRDDLAMNQFHAAGKDLSETEQAAMTRLYAKRFDADKAIAEIDALTKNASAYGFSPKNLEEFAAERKLIGSGWQPPRGKMYEVNINAHPDQFLDWDKPVAEQPGGALDIARSINFPFKADRGFDLTGANLYHGLSEKAASRYHETADSIFGGRNSGGASDMLKEAGIPGIKYLDQGSRAGTPMPNTSIQYQNGKYYLFDDLGNVVAHAPDLETAKAYRAGTVAPKPTSNYVVFNDKIIDILRKYGLAGGAVGAAAASTPRDAYAENEKNRESLKNVPASFDDRFAPVNAQPGIRPENIGGVPFHRFPSPPSRTEVV